MLQAGHDVAVYESVFAVDLTADSSAVLALFQPEVVEISIRLVHGDVQDASAPFGTRYVDLRPRVKEIVEIVRRKSRALIVLGGPGFNDYANLAIESASDAMLLRMKRGYTVRQVRAALESLSRSAVPFGASLMFGTPGETPDTIAETLAVLADYEIPLGVWGTVGIYLWTDYQDVVVEARQAGLLNNGHDLSLFDGPVYLSPNLPRPYLVDLVAALRVRRGYTVQVNRADLFAR